MRGPSAVGEATAARARRRGSPGPTDSDARRVEPLRRRRPAAPAARSWPALCAPRRASLSIGGGRALLSLLRPRRRAWARALAANGPTGLSLLFKRKSLPVAARWRQRCPGPQPCYRRLPGRLAQGLLPPGLPAGRGWRRQALAESLLRGVSQEGDRCGSPAQSGFPSQGGATCSKLQVRKGGEEQSAEHEHMRTIHPCV
jgi:hypothetical protein